MMMLTDEPVYSEMVKSLQEVFLIDLFFFFYFCVYQLFKSVKMGTTLVVFYYLLVKTCSNCGISEISSHISPVQHCDS